jgi:hypothetical protein
MKRFVSTYAVPQAEIANPVVYTSEHVCHQVAHRYIDKYDRYISYLTVDVFKIYERNLLGSKERRKLTVEMVEHIHAEISAAMRKIPHRLDVETIIDHHRLKRSITACCRVEFLILREDRALNLEGIQIVQERQYCRLIRYAPRVHLIGHAIARFMQRGKLPPEAIVGDIQKITILSRYFEEIIGPNNPIAYALPQGILHGRIGQAYGESDFGWLFQTTRDHLTKPSRRLRPRGKAAVNRDIDFITFYDTGMLNPRLKDLHALLTDVQCLCLDAACIRYRSEFFEGEISEADKSVLDAARSVVKDALATSTWQEYLRQREDQESLKAISKLPAATTRMDRLFKSSVE